MSNVVIVGAGPAGIAAATVIARADLSITIIDEARRPGGQIHRTPAPGLLLDMRVVLGADYPAYDSFHLAVRALGDRVRYRPETLAWNVAGGEVHIASIGKLEALPYDALLLATGATDRVMPLTGWTLPGVFTLGAAQVLLKEQGCLLGQRVVFCGSSPLLYLAALQYLRVGGNVAAVLDTTSFYDKLRAVPGMLAVPGLLTKGVRYMAALRRHGVPVLHGVRLDTIEGQGRAEVVAYRLKDGSRHRVECDAVAYGHGLRSETQLAELAGCELRYDAAQRQYLPVADRDGRAGQGIYLAGDGSAIGGAQAASLSGMLAGAAIARDLGLPVGLPDIAAHHRALHRLRNFQRAMAPAFAWPSHLAGELADDVTVCRCEQITAGTIRQSLRQSIGVSELNRVKAATRCGMGRCQGRFCGAAAAELTAAHFGRIDGPLDRLRAQPPIKPLPIGVANGIGP